MRAAIERWRESVQQRASLAELVFRPALEGNLLPLEAPLLEDEDTTDRVVGS